MICLLFNIHDSNGSSISHSLVRSQRGPTGFCSNPPNSKNLYRDDLTWPNQNKKEKNIHRLNENHTSQDPPSTSIDNHVD